ncbi:hypothetical protein TL16_g08824, partial [Triparma laevis f. inornata]
QEGVGVGGEEKKDEGNNSLKELVPTLTKLSLSLQQQNTLLQSIEKKTREDCQVVLKDGIWVLQRVHDRQKVIMQKKNESKGINVGGATESTLVNMLPRNETVPPTYIWSVLERLRGEAMEAEVKVAKLQKQISAGRAEVAASAQKNRHGGDPREQIKNVVTANHRNFLNIAGLVSSNNQRMTMLKKKTLRSGYSSNNKAIVELTASNRSNSSFQMDKYEKKMREEVLKYKMQQQAAAAPVAPPAGGGFGGGFGAVACTPAGGGFGGGFGAKPAVVSGFGGFGTPAAAAPLAAAGGFGGFGAPAAGSSGFGGFGATPAPALAGGFGGFGTPAAAPAAGGFGGFGAAPAPAAGGFGGFSTPAPASSLQAGAFGASANPPPPTFGHSQSFGGFGSGGGTNTLQTKKKGKGKKR